MSWKDCCSLYSREGLRSCNPKTFSTHPWNSWSQTQRTRPHFHWTPCKEVSLCSCWTTAIPCCLNYIECISFYSFTSIILCLNKDSLAYTNSVQSCEAWCITDSLSNFSWSHPKDSHPPSLPLPYPTTIRNWIYCTLGWVQYIFFDLSCFCRVTLQLICDDISWVGGKCETMFPNAIVKPILPVRTKHVVSFRRSLFSNSSIWWQCKGWPQLSGNITHCPLQKGHLDNIDITRLQMIFSKSVYTYHFWMTYLWFTCLLRYQLFLKLMSCLATLHKRLLVSLLSQMLNLML